MPPDRPWPHAPHDLRANHAPHTGKILVPTAPRNTKATQTMKEDKDGAHRLGRRSFTMARHRLRVRRQLRAHLRRGCPRRVELRQHPLGLVQRAAAPGNQLGEPSLPAPQLLPAGGVARRNTDHEDSVRGAASAVSPPSHRRGSLGNALPFGCVCVCVFAPRTAGRGVLLRTGVSPGCALAPRVPPRPMAAPRPLPAGSGPAPPASFAWRSRPETSRAPPLRPGAPAPPYASQRPACHHRLSLALTNSANAILAVKESVHASAALGVPPPTACRPRAQPRAAAPSASQCRSPAAPMPHAQRLPHTRHQTPNAKQAV